jgi:hypothetical protein
VRVPKALFAPGPPHLRLASRDTLELDTSSEMLDLHKLKIGDVLSWEDVSEVHRVRNGIYQREGRVVSLLTDFGRINPCYPDFHGNTEDTIFYTGAGRRGDQKLDSFNRALLNAVQTMHAVPLFNKLKPGAWQFLGFWRVSTGEYVFDEIQKRMIWKFKLLRGE